MGVTNKPRDTIGFEELDFRVVKDLLVLFGGDSQYHRFSFRELKYILRDKDYGINKLFYTLKVLVEKGVVCKERWTKKSFRDEEGNLVVSRGNVFVYGQGLIAGNVEQFVRGFLSLCESEKEEK
jgi:hypothetical protein